MSVSEHTISWHVCRSFSSTHLEDDCPCPQEACGFVARDKIRVDCPEHSIWAAKSIRRSHRPDACPGPVVAGIPVHSDLMTSLIQMHDGDVLPALPVAQARGRAAEERVTTARNALTQFFVRVADEDCARTDDVYEDPQGDHTVMDQYLYMVAVLEGAIRAQERLRQEEM